PELLPPDVWTTHGLARRNLQMLATEATRTQVTTAVGDADAMRYYPAFDLPERGALPEQDPIARRHTAQLLVAPRADGTLTIGDTHVDDTPGAFGSDEDADRYLISRATEVLVEPPAIRRRWTGSYLRRTDPGD